MPLFIGDWDKQNGTPVVRVYIIAVDPHSETVAALVDRKLVFNIPASQIIWSRWGND